MGERHTVGQKIKKKSRPKKLVKSNKSISIFCNFKNGQKSIFELVKSLKLPKIQFHKKKLIYLISLVYLSGLFKIFWPTVGQRSRNWILNWFLLPAKEDAPRIVHSMYIANMICKGLVHTKFKQSVRSRNFCVSICIRFVVSPTEAKYQKIFSRQ